MLPHRVIPFHGDQLIAVQQPDGTIFVHFARVCENLGLSRPTQVRKVSAHAVLSKGLLTLPIETEGGAQQVQCLRVDLLPLWMAGLHASRVKEHLREKLERYQAEAAQVLWNAFRDRIVVEETASGPIADDPSIQQLQRIAEMGRAIMHMAEQQIELQRQQAALTARMDSAARVIRGYDGRIGTVEEHLATVDVRVGLLEARLRPAATIDEEQAAEVSSQVKALAQALTAQDSSKNHYQGIFAELYRRFGVSSYKLIRQEQYTDVIAFLEEWRAPKAGKP
jgi:hypothetical protein